MLTAATTTIAGQPTPDAKHLGVAVLVAVFALLISGLISLAREMREETAHRP
ncbi:MAG TPA: hypothetical protein PLN33_01700 [Hyphomonadaceae bacterium]|jgi:hypothetical protein|nr:hypothetical protein [Hyphomonadaceae bacterium]HPN05934.1 hypothetical protein [Hyphomonadaceae bacterium]